MDAHEPRKLVGKTYFHINNGGVTFEVFDTLNGPALVVRANHFGIQTNNMDLSVTKEGIEELSDMLNAACYHDFRPVSKHWPTAQTPDERKTYTGSTEEGEEMEGEPE